MNDTTKRSRPTHLFPPRRSRKTAPPIDHAKRFHAALEEVLIEDRLAKANQPPRPACFACSAESVGLAIAPVEVTPGYAGPTQLGCALCASCHHKSQTDDTFRESIFREMATAWNDGRGCLLLVRDDGREGSE